MAIHRFERSQTIRATVEEAWAFFSNPANLREITPTELGFEVLSDVPPQIYAGLMIEYRVRPLFGIPMNWLTEITQVEDGRFFVDEQRVGPYAIWHHEHRFSSLPDGRLEIHDLITYAPPFGVLGEIIHPFLIAPQLEKIFAHRNKVVAARFPDAPK